MHFNMPSAKGEQINQPSIYQLISPRWCIYMSERWVSIGSDNGLAPVWHQAISWINTDLLSVRPLGTNFSEIWIKIRTLNSLKCMWKYHLRMAFILFRGKWINSVLRGPVQKKHNNSVGLSNSFKTNHNKPNIVYFLNSLRPSDAYMRQ